MVSNAFLYVSDTLKSSAFLDNMKKNDLKYLKDLLTGQLEDLLSEAGKTVTGMTDEKDNFPDPTDRATLESQRAFELRIRDRERKLILKIKEALERIENGTFGICDGCGEEISFKRLKARPVTTYCIECKTKQEDVEKASRTIRAPRIQS